MRHGTYIQGCRDSHITVVCMIPVGWAGYRGPLCSDDLLVSQMSDGLGWGFVLLLSFVRFAEHGTGRYMKAACCVVFTLLGSWTECIAMIPRHLTPPLAPVVL